MEKKNEKEHKIEKGKKNGLTQKKMNKEKINYDKL